MKKQITILSVILLLVTTFLAGAQEQYLRYNYIKNGNTFTGAERAQVPGSTPISMKLSRVIFSDGFNMYILRLDFEDVSPWKMPANAPMTVLTSEGKTVILKNEGKDPTMVAPEGYTKGGRKMYWNYGLYYLEEADLKKMLSGVTSIDVTKRWSTDGSIKITYKDNEFSSALKKQYDAISSAPAAKVKVTNQLKSLSDQGGNRLVETEQISVGGQMAISIVYLYYADSNLENYDLNLFIPGKTAPIGSQVLITTASGSTIELQQEKDMLAGRVICYPTTDQIKQMSHGVTKVSIQTVSGPVTIPVGSAVFGGAISELYNALQTVAIL